MSALQFLVFCSGMMILVVQVMGHFHQVRPDVLPDPNLIPEDRFQTTHAPTHHEHEHHEHGHHDPNQGGWNFNYGYNYDYYTSADTDYKSILHETTDYEDLSVTPSENTHADGFSTTPQPHDSEHEHFKASVGTIYPWNCMICLVIAALILYF